MGKVIVWYWNLLHYCLFLLYCKLYYVTKFLSPSFWFVKLSFMNKYFDKHGVTYFTSSAENNAYNNEKYGVNSIWAGGGMVCVFMCIELIVLNFIQCVSGFLFIYKLLIMKSLLPILFVFLLVTIGYIFNYYTLFKKDRYLFFFKEFSKFSKKERRKYFFVSFCIFSVLLVIVSYSFHEVIFLAKQKKFGVRNM